jgi:O-antigen/teichoic acid export membrane protein
MLMALISGVTSGVGNFLLGTRLSHVGAMGAGFTGPLNLVILLIYRFATIINTKRKHKTWIDKENSNFFHKTTHKFVY